MKKLTILIIFISGFIFGNVTSASFLKSAQAEVDHMDRSDLRSDKDFRKAVQDIIEDCEIDDNEIDC